MAKVHNDCPFSREEIDAFHAALYTVNMTKPCINPAPLNWVKGWQWHNINYRPRKRVSNDSYDK